MPEGPKRAQDYDAQTRGEGKDAYDLFDVLKHHADRPERIAATIASLRAIEPAEPDAIKDALRILREDFGIVTGTGPKRAASSYPSAAKPRSRPTSSRTSRHSFERSSGWLGRACAWIQDR